MTNGGRQSRLRSQIVASKPAASHSPGDQSGGSGAVTKASVPPGTRHERASARKRACTARAKVAERAEDDCQLEALAQAERERVLLHEQQAWTAGLVDNRFAGCGRVLPSRLRQHAEAEVDADDELAAERSEQPQRRAGAAAEVDAARDAPRRAELRRYRVQQPIRRAERREVELRRQ